MVKNQDEEVIVTETEDTGAEPRIYELGFHLDPELPIEEVKKVYQAIHELIAAKGTCVAEVEPEKIQLAYTISRQEVAGRRDFNSAYFAWVVYEMLATDHAEVITTMSANKSVVRFVDLITTKDEARHSLEVHELLAKTPASEVEGEEISSTELDAALESVAL